MADLIVLLVQPDAAERARTLAALAQCCDPAGVHAAGSPEEAEAVLGLHAPPNGVRAPALVLLDLPPEQGVPLLGRIRSHPRTGGVPVVAIAAAADRRLQDAWYRGGANSVVGLARDEAELLQKMRRLVSYWTTVNVTNRPSRV